MSESVSCRFCETRIPVTQNLFADLGIAPPSNAFRLAHEKHHEQPCFPLRAVTCPACRLVQVVEAPPKEALFTADYAYHSSIAASWLAHARSYVGMVTARLALDATSFVVEVASNDGYLLQYVRERGIRCLGIEPTSGTARIARERGVETAELFLGRDTARQVAQQHGQADLVVANNVLAHVPDLRDFVAGISTLLAPHGTATFEFPHLVRLVNDAQFDTIYHEHYSYLSLLAVEQVLATAGLVVWDIEELSTHGGSLRVWAQHRSNKRPAAETVDAMRAMEREVGVHRDAFYHTLQPRAEQIRDSLRAFLEQCRRDGARVVGYGAAAKGNTLLNFAGVSHELLPWVADASPHKQGRYLPGSQIPVVSPDRIAQERPAFILLLPWNLAPELEQTLGFAREWRARFVTCIPELRVR